MSDMVKLHAFLCSNLLSLFCFSCRSYEYFPIMSSCIFLSFASFIAESAIIELERRRILKEAQLISLVGFGENSVILKDVKKENRLIEVQIRDRRLKCITDDKFDCIHVGFALALPEVREALDK